MANWSHQHETSDPLSQLIAKESRTCKGCRFRIVEQCFGETVEICRLGKRKMRKCSLYGEKT